MMTGRKTPQFFFIIILTVFFNLIFSGNSNADPLSINGPSQISSGGTQNFTASGGSGGYNWGVAGGAGSSSGTSGSSTVISSSSITSNSNCNENITLCVQDSDGSISCKKIAVNKSTSQEIAYRRSVCTATYGPISYNFRFYYYWYRQTLCDGSEYPAPGSIDAPFMGCRINYSALSCFQGCQILDYAEECYFGECDQYNLYQSWAGGYEPPVGDLRSADMKANGCCP